MPVISLKEWAGDTLSPTKPRTSDQVASVLSNLLQTGLSTRSKNIEDQQIRRAAANILGVPEEQVPLGMLKKEDLAELQKEKFKETIKPKEWKPTTEEEYVRAEQAKKQKSDQYTPEQIQQMFGGNVPPGTTMKLGNLTVPLNPKLSQEQAASVAAADEVKDDVNSFKDLLTTHTGEWGSIAKLTLPYALIGGDTEEMKRITDQLRARIPFAKGGKQLTPFEAKTLFQLLPQPGQSKETITKNLDKFVSEFNRISEIAIKGTSGIQSSQNKVGKYTLIK